jgi:hypothetical protein
VVVTLDTLDIAGAAGSVHWVTALLAAVQADPLLLHAWTV